MKDELDELFAHETDGRLDDVSQALSTERSVVDLHQEAHVPRQRHQQGHALGDLVEILVYWFTANVTVRSWRLERERASGARRAGERIGARRGGARRLHEVQAAA